ncbi:MAG: hypothetical protein JKY01_08815 [Pseudomonadales bacterium]|nr:hypothetical protein [Pseudomonadales bacterium]
MFNFIRFSFSIALLFLLTACLNDDSGKSSSSLTYHPSVTENFEAVVVEGIASKGIISHARVVIYAADDGYGDTLALGVGHTNESGEYRIEIPFAYQGSIVAQIERDNSASGISTQMVCDSIEGCGASDSLAREYDLNGNGAIDFGERFPILDSFVIRGVNFTSGTREAITLHVTPLTHLVDLLTLSFGDSYSRQSILQADSHVADLFGLTKRLSSIQPVDLTNENAVQGLGVEQMRYNVFAAAFAGLATHRKELGGVIKKFSDLFISNGGQFPLVDESIAGVGFGSLLNVASSLAEFLEPRNDNFVQLSLLLKGELVDVRHRAKSSTLTDAVQSISLNLDALSKAKQFVSEMQDWQEFLTINEQRGVGFTERTTELKTFVDEAQLATSFLAAAKYTPVLAVMPLIASNEDAIEYFCNNMSGSLGYWCTELLANYNLEDLDCSSETNPICKMIADKLVVSVPTFEEGLSADYAVLNNTVHVYGFAYDQDIDLLFRLTDYDLNSKVAVTGEGEMFNNNTYFSILGKVGLGKSGDSGDFQGASEIVISVVDAADESFTISLRHGENAMAIVGFEAMSLSGHWADITVISNMDDWGDRSERVKIESAGKQLVLTHLKNEGSGFSAINQDGIAFSLNLTQMKDGEVGSIVLDEDILAVIVRENSNLYVEFNDGDRRDITALIL